MTMQNHKFFKKPTAYSNKLKTIKGFSPTPMNIGVSPDMASGRGFTLVEMLVSISVFMVVMLVAAGSLLSIIDGNGKAQSLKSVMNNLNFAVESMAKNIRVGTDYKCLSGSSSCISGESGIEFTSYKDSDELPGNDVVVYKYKENDSVSHTGSIERCVRVSSDLSSYCTVDANFSPITAPEVKITGISFYVSNSVKPRVLLTISGYAGSKERIKTNFNLQTTVSQRAF